MQSVELDVTVPDRLAITPMADGRWLQPNGASVGADALASESESPSQHLSER